MKYPILRLVTPVIALGALAACAEEVEAPVYQVVSLEVRDIVVSASAAGSVEPVTTVEVKSKASGEITEVTVEAGDEVRRGQRLVLVDPRVPSNALVQAEADLEVAKAQVETSQSQLRRSEALYETQSITEQEWENAKLAAATAKASHVRAERALEDARISFEDTDVRAPSDGVILEKGVEVGTVIASASSAVGGGAVLLRMANLDTVQVRTLVDETDIGKVQPGLDVTIVVDAYPNRPFRGVVLKIEPEALEEQNVTMFPVLIRIANTEKLLRPGMNSEVEIHIGFEEQVLSVRNAALRTQRDVGSAAAVLGLDMETVQQQLAAAREDDSGDRGGDSHDGQPLGDNGAATKPTGENTVSFRGREVELPAGVTHAQIEPIMEKMQGGGGFQALSAAERTLMGRVMRAGGGGGRPGGRGGRRANAAEAGGEYIVFAMRNGEPTAIPIRTGLTDLDYSQVLSGLTERDSVLVLPSASLLRQQQEFQERIDRVTQRTSPIRRN